MARIATDVTAVWRALNWTTEMLSDVSLMVWDSELVMTKPSGATVSLEPLWHELTQLTRRSVAATDRGSQLRIRSPKAPVPLFNRTDTSSSPMPFFLSVLVGLTNSYSIVHHGQAKTGGRRNIGNPRVSESASVQGGKKKPQRVGCGLVAEQRPCTSLHTARWLSLFGTF